MDDVANMLSFSLAVLLLSSVLPAASGEISSTISISDNCMLTLTSPANEIYISRPLYLTLSVDTTCLALNGSEARRQIGNKRIDLTISTNSSLVSVIPADKTTDLELWPVYFASQVVETTFKVTPGISLFTEPISVTVTVTVPEKEKSDNSKSFTLMLIDDRVDVGFFHNETTCVSNEACILEIIAKITPTLSAIYVTLSVPDAGVEEETFPVLGLIPKNVAIETTGDFTASLSVPEQSVGKVYLSRQDMLIHVTPNKMMEELDDLRRSYTILMEELDDLRHSYTILYQQYLNDSALRPRTISATTESPTAESPTTESPTTESPTTESPTTESPTIESPTTESPVPTLTVSTTIATTSSTTATASSSLSPSPTSSTELAPTSTEPGPELPNDSTLLYGGLMAFIAVLVVCVAAYLLYHNKDKLLELIGGKKESVVEMAMKSRSKKSKGYQKLPTSIHDTMTHED